MKKHNLIALLAALLLLLCSCGNKPAGDTVESASFLEKAAVSLQQGHLFFTGKVLSAVAESKTITYYDAQVEKSTFYRVEVTDDLFGCLPARTLTVCVLGRIENFSDRFNLEKNKEYLFDTTLWVQGEEAVLLLPTFYRALPERVEDTLYYTDAAGKAIMDCSYTAYRQKLLALAQEHQYTAATVLTAAKERLQTATRRDATCLEKLEITGLDRQEIATTVQTAQTLLERANSTATTWEGIRGLLQ
jgi:hypothetical protein